MDSNSASGFIRFFSAEGRGVPFGEDVFEGAHDFGVPEEDADEAEVAGDFPG